MKFAATMFENIIALSNLHFHVFQPLVWYDNSLLRKKKKKYYKIISYRLKEIDFSSYKRDNSFLFSAHRSEEKAYRIPCTSILNRITVRGDQNSSKKIHQCTCIWHFFDHVPFPGCNRSLTLVLSFQLRLSPKQISKMNSCSPLATIYISCNFFPAVVGGRGRRVRERGERGKKTQMKKKKKERKEGKKKFRGDRVSPRELTPPTNAIPPPLLNYPSPALFTPPRSRSV